MGIICLMILFPPYRFSGQYAPIFNPPSGGVSSSFDGMPSFIGEIDHIHYGRLGLQILIVIILMLVIRMIMELCAREYELRHDNNQD